MLRVTRLTDYGILLMGYLTRLPRETVCNTRDLAAEAGLPIGTVGKILKVLTREGLLISQRGVHGGYQLARAPEEISLADIITALDGPIAVTQGSVAASYLHQDGELSAKVQCSIGSNWQLINRAVAEALRNISLWDMSKKVNP